MLKDKGLRLKIRINLILDLFIGLSEDINIYDADLIHFIAIDSSTHHLINNEYREKTNPRHICRWICLDLSRREG